MKKTLLTLSIFCLTFFSMLSTRAQDSTALKFKLNSSGTHYFQTTVLNQVWLRFNQNNPGSLVQNLPEEQTWDIGLRRTRIQFFGQVTDRAFIYFQFGQNNFNSETNLNANRKNTAFFHDALCEYRLSKGHQLIVGGGLTITNGLSRFSQPAIGSILTLDVPIFAQTTVDQTDQFSRKLSVYARGQIHKFDYRFALSEPFPITSSGSAPPALVKNQANFSLNGHHWQQQAYIMYQFFEHEPSTIPYMAGTYLGKKKVLNLSVGAIHHKNATWLLNENGDTTFNNMTHFAVESYLDMPLNKTKGTAISAYAGWFSTNYGTNYLRYNGIMNMASGTSLNASNSISGSGPVYGNAFPMFGTGQVVYTQLGYLLPKFASSPLRLLPYLSATFAKFDKLEGLPNHIYNAGINLLAWDHKVKFTIDVQNRPVFEVENTKIKAGERKNCFTGQFQIFF